MIVQLSAICTDRMTNLQKLYLETSNAAWVSCFDDRPGKLFDGLEHIRATIVLSVHGKAKTTQLATTKLLRWPTESRTSLFDSLTYDMISGMEVSGSFPKVGGYQLHRLIEKVKTQPKTLGLSHIDKGINKVYYYRSPLYWIRSMNFLPHFSAEGAERSVHHFKDFSVTSAEIAPVVGSIINSTLFYLWFIVYGNGRNVAIRDILTLPCPDSLLNSEPILSQLFEKLMLDYEKHSIIKRRRDGVEYQEFYPAKSKPIIDQIDRVLAKHYGFTDEETDFIINYDIKYRMGRGGDEAED